MQSARKQDAWAWPLAIAVITAFVYGRVLHQDFVHWDDKAHIFGNPNLHIIDAPHLLKFWTAPYEHLYIPLSYMAFAGLAALSRMPHRDLAVTQIATLYNPHVFHTANLTLHVINTLLVFAILRLLTRPADTANRRQYNLPAAVGALLFALHPLQVESVAWISELRGLLSNFFTLGAICLYIDAHGDGSTAIVRRPGYWTALILTIAALLCKPSAVVLPLLLFIIDRWLLGRSTRESAIAVLPWVIIAVPFVVITHNVQPVSAEGMGAVQWYQRPLIAADALAFYLGKLFAPIGLTIEYGRTPASVLTHSWGKLTWLAPAAVAALGFVGRRRYPWLVAGALISVCVLLPVLGLVPFAYQHYSTVADRYVYLAMLGPALIVARLIAEIDFLSTVKGRVAIGVASVALAACAGLTFQQVRHWDNSSSLFRYAVRMNPTSYGLRTNYGISLDDNGKFDAAIDQYTAAVQLDPDEPEAYQSMGMSLLHEGKDKDAESWFRKELAIDSTVSAAHGALGIALMNQGRPQDALPELETASAMSPDEPEDHTHYAYALMAVNRTDDATAEFQKALALDSSNVGALVGLAQLQLAAGQLDQAEANAGRAADLSPNDPQAAAGYAGVLQKEGKTDQAITVYRHAIMLDPKSDALEFSLGSAYFGEKDLPDAIKHLQRAVQLGPTAFHHDRLGVAYATAGNLATAKSEFEAAVKIDPSSAEAQRHLSMISTEMTKLGTSR